MTATLFGGLRVLELGGGMAAPMAGMIFADHGADVVKVEPPWGDWARNCPGFVMWNRGKRSVSLDLRMGAARDELHALVRDTDVVLVAVGTGVAARLTADYETVAGLNPTAVYCEITGFGPMEQFGDVKAYEGVVSAAIGRMVGLDRLSGAAAGHPPDVPAYTAAPVNSYGAANLAVQGIVGALIARDATGVGDRVNVSLAVSSTVGSMRHAFAVKDRPAEHTEKQSLVRRGIELTFIVAQCSDGKWIQMCARQDDHFRNWLHAVGLEAVLDDPRFANAPLGFTNVADVEELEMMLRARMRERTQDEWMELFTEKYDVGADPFLTPEEFLRHPQMVLNDRIVVIDDPNLGPVTQVGALALMSETPAVMNRPAPALPSYTEDGDRIAWLDRDAPSLSPHARVREGAGPPSPDARHPLAGVTVVELASFLAGPLGGTLVAELGARVIKVEPPEGDSFRRVGLESVHLMSGKESIVLDLKADTGRAALTRLLGRADVLFQNFRPGVAARLGFDFESVHRLNPGLVYVTAGSYGPKGPHSHRAAFHSTPNALSGGGILQAGVGNPPVDDSYPDPCAGTAVATAIMLGLYHRSRTGVGQHIETSMLASAGYVHSDNLVLYPGAPAWRLPDHQQHGPSALYRLYECAEGWVFVAVVTDDEWNGLVAALHDTALGSDDRFADAAGRARHDSDLARVLAKIFASANAAQWVDLLSGHDVAVVQADQTSFENALIGSGTLALAEHAEFGKYWRFRPRIRYDRLATSVGEPCSLGEHTEAVLTELGYSPEEVEALVAATGPKVSSPAAQR